MTIKLKLFLIGTLVFIGFVVTTTSTVVSTQNIQKLNTATIQGRDLMNGFLELSSQSKDMLSAGNLATTLESWKTNWSEFVTQYDQFISSPYVSELLSTDEDSSLIDSLNDTWEILQLNATKVATNTQALVDT